MGTIGTKIENNQMKSFYQRVMRMLNDSLGQVYDPGQYSVQISGSYARDCYKERDYYGDLDLLIVLKNSEDLPDNLEKFVDNSSFTVDRAGSRVMTLLERGTNYQVDLYICSEKERGCMELFLNGCKGFNIKMRSYAKSHGYSLGQYSMKDLSTGEIFYFSSELEVFEKLGLQYVDVEDRSYKTKID